MNDSQRDALMLLHSYAGDSLDVWMLAGPRGAHQRVQIMAALEGKRVPQAKAGVTAIRNRLHMLAGPAIKETGCVAERDADFLAWARAQLTVRATP